MNKQHDPSIAIDMPARRAFVAFTEKTDLPLLRRFLPRGFRHCSIHINDGFAWVSVEALAGYTEIVTHQVSPSEDLAAVLRTEGLTVVEVSLRRDAKARRMQLPAIYSCVEEAKRILGIRRPLIITPSQLYRHLTKGRI